VSVTRVTRFQAREGKADQLRAFLAAVHPLISQSPGCLFCQLLQGEDKANEFLVIEVWTSVAMHEASVKNIPPAKIAEAMPLLAAPPSGSYFSALP
jgi:quinol monooxygenase YgiN